MTVLKPAAGTVVPYPTGITGPPTRRGRPHPNPAKLGLHVWMLPIAGLTKPANAFPNGQQFTFQADPLESFGEDGTSTYSDYDTPSGQHTQFIGTQLRQVQMETLFMDGEPWWSLLRQGETLDPQQAVQDLSYIREKGTIFHLLAQQPGWRARYDIDYPAQLRSFHWEVRAGETDAYYCTCSFVEFSSPELEEFIAQSSAHPKLPVSLPVAQLPANRDTLSKQAKFYYGDPHQYRRIAAANGITDLGANTRLTTRNVKRSKIVIPARTAPPKKRGQHR